MSRIPERCPECGARDIDVQMLCWVACADGKSLHVFADTAEDIPERAYAYCPTCKHDWFLGGVA